MNRRGLALFPARMSMAARRRRWAFLAVWLTVTAALVWPIYPRFSGIEPRILGLPLSFAWVIFALGVMFVALILLFWRDEVGSLDEQTSERP